MLRRELFCRKPQLVGGGGDRSVPRAAGRAPPPRRCWARGGGGPAAAGAPPLRRARFYQKDGKVRERSRFPAPTVPRYDFTPARRILPCRRRYPPCPSALSCRPSGRVTPSTHATVAAMARARRRSRTPARADGAPQQARTSPGRNGREGSRRRPRDTRRTRYSPAKGTAFAFPQKGEYGGAGGVEGQPPLSPHAPRRAGDLPPMPGSSLNSRRCPPFSLRRPSPGSIKKEKHA